MAASTYRASLVTMPPELFDDICTLLDRRTLTTLARTCKAVKEKVQNPLYYHASITSFHKLSLFSRTLTNASSYSKSGDIVSKNVHDLELKLNPKKEQGSHSTAVVLSRLIGAVGRCCPKIKIKLALESATCSGQPIASFLNESFPRVTHLVLDTGPGERTQSTVARPVVMNRRARQQNFQNMLESSSNCMPSEKYWQAIFNGVTFPNLETFELLHVGVVMPPFIPPNLGRLDLKGLIQITKLVVKNAPELNSGILMQALQGAPNLKHLGLIFVPGLDYGVLAKLLEIALPHLHHLTLHVEPDNISASDVRDSVARSDPLEASDPCHLCPIIREYGKDIPQLDIFLPYVCRELFLSVAERQKLNNAGFKVTIGDPYGQIVPGERVDQTTLSTVLGEHRKVVAEARFRELVKQNIATSGGTKSTVLAEYEERRKALDRITGKGKLRKIQVSSRLCRSYETWEELLALASLEKGIPWYLENKRPDSVTAH